MSRLLTVLHVYYHSQVDYFIEKLANINGVEWDLIVTYSVYSESTEKKLRAFKPDVKFRLVKNAGYDVWPFIQVIQETDFSKYRYVLKLHTKRAANYKINGISMKNWMWRNLLVDSLLKSASRFRSCVKILEDNERVGLVCSYELYKDLSGMHPLDLDMLRNEAERIALDVNGGHFCAGTMFMARMASLKKLTNIEFSDDLWRTPNESGISCTIAHTYERLLCLIVSDAGYSTARMISYASSGAKAFYRMRLYPTFKNVFNIDRNPVNREKLLTILGMRFRVSRRKRV